MNEKYWDTFVVTGRAADYLRYKNAIDDANSDEECESRTGAKKRESDRSNRDGAVGSTYR